MQKRTPLCREVHRLRDRGEASDLSLEQQMRRASGSSRVRDKPKEYTQQRRLLVYKVAVNCAGLGYLAETSVFLPGERDERAADILGVCVPRINHPRRLSHHVRSCRTKGVRTCACGKGNGLVRIEPEFEALNLLKVDDVSEA